ncbi:MAG: hypothetical protein JWM74_4422, partial [Myxococcaceae bacterium]|nr:hypothetical protein [Myxococcaceae bacterium]
MQGPTSRRIRLSKALPSLVLVGVVATTGASALAGCGAHPAPPPARAAVAPAKPLASAAPPPVVIRMRPSEVDDALRAEWSRASVTPSARVDDAGYLRRVTLSVTGSLPRPEKVTAFVADTSPDKRAKVVDELLASPRYVDHMTNTWDRILLGRDTRGANLVDRKAFRTWLHGQFDKNLPYDQLVRALVDATGRNSDGASLDAPAAEPPLNGAVNYYLRYTDVPDLAGTTSRIFLGVQIQCAQCHDHKSEKWKTSEFHSFAACFMRTRIDPIDRGKTMGTRRVDVRDVDHPIRLAKRMDMPDIANAPPRALDGTDFTKSANRRGALADWMTSKDNPWFKREIVNRVWAQMLGRGFVDPVDDFREKNPPIAPALLDAIADDFVRGGWDLKSLIRLIAQTEAYQRAPAAGAEGAMDEKLWAHFQIQRLGPDELLDAVMQASKLDLGGDNVNDVRTGIRKQLAFLFDVDEETDHHDEFDGTITQALLLMNGKIMGRAIERNGGTLTDVLALSGDEARVRALYLRTLSREPSPEELAQATTFV